MDTEDTDSLGSARTEEVQVNSSSLSEYAVSDDFVGDSIGHDIFDEYKALCAEYEAPSLEELQNMVAVNAYHIAQLQTQTNYLIRELQSFGRTIPPIAHASVVCEPARTLQQAAIRCRLRYILYLLTHFTSTTTPLWRVKQVLSEASGLSMKQVNTWFTNHRKRLKSKTAGLFDCKLFEQDVLM